MAIGSTPEIGTGFGLWRDMTPEQRTAWFEYMNKNVSINFFARSINILKISEGMASLAFSI